MTMFPSSPPTLNDGNSFAGTIFKWTNYIHRWQYRYLILRDGTLSYYKAESESGYCCRGAVRVAKAEIEVHAFYNCRFDVKVGDCIYYFYAKDSDERRKWLDVLEAAKEGASSEDEEKFFDAVEYDERMVECKVKENLQLIKERVDQENSKWRQVQEERNLKVYRKDFDIDGIACDRIMRASLIIPGVTGHEVCHYFFDKDGEKRFEWEGTVEKVDILEKQTESTIIIQQIYKRKLLSTQRDTCYTSHIRQLHKDEMERLDKEVGSPWMVINFPTKHDGAKNDGYVRAEANITMVCQTCTINEVKAKEYTRDNVACKMTYMAQVNAGGLAPTWTVRQVTEREFVNFLNKFSNFVQTVTKDKPLEL